MSRNYLSILVALLIVVSVIGCGQDPNPVQSDIQQPYLKAADAVPADAVIDSAKIFMYVNMTDTQSVEVHTVNQAWNEGDVTYASFADSYDSAAIATLSLEEAGWVSVDVSALAQGWFDSTMENYGFFITPVEGDTAATMFDSKEAEDNHPYLQVFLTTHEGSSSETFDAVADAYIYSDAPDSNFGAETSLIAELTPADSVTPSTIYQTLVRFEFPVVVRLSSIGDRAWLDENKDGIQDEGEMGMADIVVNLYDCEDSMLATTMTNADGMYLFDSLMAGDYKLEFVAPENYLFSPADQGEDDAMDSDADPMTGFTTCFSTLPGVNHSSVDGGFYHAPASVGDFVWNDENMNGLQDEGEMGFADIEVQLYDCDGNLLAATMTDADGMYMFEDLNAGSYRLKVVNPFGYIVTYMDQGDDDAIDSDFNQYQKNTTCITLDWGEELMMVDAGLFAFDGCTLGKGYWKNHAGFGPQADELSKLLPIWLGDDSGDKSMAVTDAQIAVDILQQQTYGAPSNGITKLYAHLLTAKLNIVNFANPADIHETIAEADSFLADHDWNDWASLEKSDKQMILMWKDMLESYNEGMIGPGTCEEDEVEDYD